jgi:hypothetical protein
MTQLAHHHVDAGIRQWDMLGVALAELDILVAMLLGGRPKRDSISSSISSPMARPWGPTILAAGKTSAPAPLPISKTTSPGWSLGLQLDRAAAASEDLLRPGLDQDCSMRKQLAGEPQAV